MNDIIDTMKSDITVSAIYDSLRDVMDPELYISIYDLGLVYDVRFEKGIATITMTLTTIGCPLFPVIEKDIRSQVSKVPKVKDVNIKLTFDPPWDAERMTDEGKAVLGI